MKGGSSTYSTSIEHARNYMSWIVDQFKPCLHGAVMEVGLGHGGYRQYLGAARYTGVDIDQASIRHAREANPDGSYIQADICDESFPLLHANAFDAVLCVNVLEHITEDAKAVAHLLHVLRPGGHLLLMVPAHPQLYSALDRLAGHCRRYSRRSLLALLHGLASVEKCYYINPLGGLGWWLNKWLGHNDLDSPGVNRQILVFDRYILPLSRMLTPLTKDLFGQSIICIATKEGPA